MQISEMLKYADFEQLALRESEIKPLWENSVFAECPACGQRETRRRWNETLHICPSCGKYLPIGSHYRLYLILDRGSFRELNFETGTVDPLNFPGYSEKLSAQRQKTGLSDAALAAVGKIEGMPVAAVVLDSRFLMGSMGSAVGEKVTKTVEYAAQRKLPLIIFSASGGARMQEGIFSLMQMAKTSAALARLSEAGGLFISFLTNPTTGGVTASFASLGDIILAEPGALIGFAGPRVIEQTIGEKLPTGFQCSEFQQAHGFVDQIVPRSEMRSVLAQILRLHWKERRSA